MRHKHKGVGASFRVSALQKVGCFYIKEDLRMPTITKKELEDYKKMCYDREHGRLLTIDGLRLICDGLNRDLEAIWKHFLETLARI